MTLQQEIELFEEGMMVSGILAEYKLEEKQVELGVLYNEKQVVVSQNISELKSIKSPIFSSPTKRALFEALYQGPVHSMKDSTK